MIDAYTLFAWFVLALTLVVAVSAIVYLGSLPYSIASKNGHPQAAMVNALSWIGLALGGLGWPLAFVWAFWRKGTAEEAVDGESAPGELQELRRRMAELQQQIVALRESRGDS